MQDEIDIRAARVELEMSQAEFAKAFEVDQSTVSIWETKGLPNKPMIRESFQRRLAALREAKAA